jgi:transcriptional regulator with XRE-family HTH domain
MEIVIGQNIRRRRLERNLSQEALAFEVGVAARHLGRIERGTVSATIGIVARIAGALGCDPTELFEDSDAPMPANLPRGRHAQTRPVTYLEAAEVSSAYEPDPEGSNDDIPSAELATLQSILRHGNSGIYAAAAERMISEFVAEAGGAGNLTPDQLERIQLARAWAQAKDIDKDRPQH